MISAPHRGICIGLAILIGATLWAAWSTLDRGFIGDDFGYIARFGRMPLSGWPMLFTRDWSGGIWGLPLPELRPFAALSFAIDGRVWGVNPLGFHLTNWLLYLTGAILVSCIAHRLQPNPRWLGVAAGLIFALHPAHAEPVAWITGRVDLLATMFYLAAFLSAIVYHQTGAPRALAASWGAYFIGVFSKEFCLTLPLLVLAWVLIFRAELSSARRKFMTLLAGWLAVVAIYWLCRHLAFGNVGAPPRSSNVLSAEFLTRQIDYLSWMIPPLYSWIIHARAALSEHAGWIVASTAILLGLACAALRWRCGSTSRGWRALLCFGLVWYWISTLPLVVASYFSPRHLYLATAGACIAVVVVAADVFRARWAALSAVGVAALLCGLRYHEAIKPWRHAAKVSELVLQKTMETRSAAPDALIVLDAPPTYEGAWMWAWATPFALEPPFVDSPLHPVLEHPEVYAEPHRWRGRPVFQLLRAAPRIALVRVTGKGTVAVDLLDPNRSVPATEQFLRDLDSLDSVQAWEQFMRRLQP